MIPKSEVRRLLLKEYSYWRDTEDDDDLSLIAVGAMGATANVLAKVLAWKPPDCPTEADDLRRSY